MEWRPPAGESRPAGERVSHGPKRKPGERYEFRCWPEHPERRQATLHRRWSLESSEQRDDIYFLPSAPTALLPKLRDGERLEVKARLEDPGLLQLWRVELAGDFPLAPSVARRLDELLRVTAALDRTARRSAAHFLSHLAGLSPRITLCTVHKARMRFRCENCLAEFTSVEALGRQATTIALEGEDPATVLSVREELGLVGLANRDYGAMLRHWLLEGAGDTPAGAFESASWRSGALQ